MIWSKSEVNMVLGNYITYPQLLTYLSCPNPSKSYQSCQIILCLPNHCANNSGNPYLTKHHIQFHVSVITSLLSHYSDWLLWPGQFRGRHDSWASETTLLSGNSTSSVQIFKWCTSNFLDDPNNLSPGHFIILQVSKSDQFLDVFMIQLGSHHFGFLRATGILQIKQWRHPQLLYFWLHRFNAISNSPPWNDDIICCKLSVEASQFCFDGTFQRWFKGFNFPIVVFDLACNRFGCWLWAYMGITRSPLPQHPG